MKRLLAIAVVFALASCGGGGSSQPPAPAYAEKMMVRLGADAPVPAEPGYNLYGTTPPTTDPQASVDKQASAPGDVMLMLGWITKEQGFSEVPQYLAAARAHANIRWAYLYDEVFWENGAITIGAHEAEVLSAADQTHAAGIKTAITILPDVILSPGFALSRINAFDVIGIDVYPAGRGPVVRAPGCPVSDNPYTDLLSCSVQKLRSLGYTGQVWYVFEAFGDTSTPDLPAKLAQQRQTISAAPSFGVTGLVSFGYYDDDMSFQPPLYPGHGSPIQSLVECSTC